MTMQCDDRKITECDSFLSEFAVKAESLRIPLSGSLELTRRCNLDCVHCYLGRKAKRDLLKDEEMSTARICALIDEITEAGCLNLLITGGDPLLRDDFVEIYRHAKERGLLVTVFTNGTMITDQIVELFAELPPVEIEISIYGATSHTYEKITRVRGSYRRCFKGIERLLRKGLRVNLKTVLMTLNRDEFGSMEDIARNFNVRFRFDAAIMPCPNGDKSPLSLRVSPEEAVEKEFSNDEKVRKWLDYYKRFKDCRFPGRLYPCGAGVTVFHVDAFGRLQPCIMTDHMACAIGETGFGTVWAGLRSQMRTGRAGADLACVKCEKANLCGYCPAFFMLENGREDLRSAYLCTMGRLRLQYINDHIVKGDTGERGE